MRRNHNSRVKIALCYLLSFVFSVMHCAGGGGTAAVPKDGAATAGSVLTQGIRRAAPEKINWHRIYDLFKVTTKTISFEDQLFWCVGLFDFINKTDVKTETLSYRGYIIKDNAIKDNASIFSISGSETANSRIRYTSQSGSIDVETKSPLVITEATGDMLTHKDTQERTRRKHSTGGLFGYAKKQSFQYGRLCVFFTWDTDILGSYDYIKCLNKPFFVDQENGKVRELTGYDLSRLEVRELFYWLGFFYGYTCSTRSGELDDKYANSDYFNLSFSITELPKGFKFGSFMDEVKSKIKEGYKEGHKAMKIATGQKQV